MKNAETISNLHHNLHKNDNNDNDDDDDDDDDAVNDNDDDNDNISSFPQHSHPLLAQRTLQNQN